MCACPSAVCWPRHVELKCCSLDRNQQGPQRPLLPPASLFRRYSLLSFSKMSLLQIEQKGVSAEERRNIIRCNKMNCNLLHKCKTDDKTYLDSVFRCHYSVLIEEIVHSCAALVDVLVEILKILPQLVLLSFTILFTALHGIVYLTAEFMQCGQNGKNKKTSPYSNLGMFTDFS